MKLIVGCGYLGLRVARRWLAEGHQVVGVVRRDSSAKRLASSKSVQPIVADVAEPSTLHGLPAAETVLYSVGYDPVGGASRRQVYRDGLQAVLDAIATETRRVIFISSTGVYTEQEGGWIDELSPCLPSRESGQALLEAEKALAAHRLAASGIVLRLAGIYGPGRLPRRTELISGEPLPIAAGEYVNLIHVEDAATAVLAAEAHAVPPRTYNISDGHPVQRREYFTELARRLGLPPPSFRDLVPGESSGRRGGNKRVGNARMLTELRIKLAYPTYHEGLAAVR